VNKSGDIVGGSSTATPGLGKAFIYQNGALIDLDAAAGGPNGWYLQRAAGINDNGLIIGFGRPLPRLVGFARATELLFEGRPVDAQEGRSAD
jgi:probable HAF family extracellular repeat protein